MIDYGNDKLNEIFQNTWPNLGWAARKPMNKDMPWINISQEEVDQLRKQKHELTEYGKQKIKQLMNNQEPYPDEMFDEAARREAENKAILAKVSEEDYQKVIEVAKQGIEQYKEALDELADTEKPFYRFFVVEYFGTGEGMSFWLKICRNYGLYDGKDYELESFKEFVGESFFFPSIEEPTEEEFRTQYANLIPDYVSKMLDKRDQPGFIWETHYHFNYS